MTKTELKTAGANQEVLEISRCALVRLAGEDRGAEYVMDGDVFRIGKSSKNDLQLDHRTVSRTHCEIVRERKGYLLRDLGSTNGTLLDGAEIKEVYVRPGAVITVGAVELRVRTFSERIELLPSDASSFGDAVGESTPMRLMYRVLERVAPTNSTVLLGGETGTGKDVIARAIHTRSKRAHRPFVVVDCGAVMGNLIESELFGHERGAFTGASERRQGAFEIADGGTVFLDELGELPLSLQPKLLRVLETRTFKRVGGNKEIAVDIRVIAASKRNLKLEVSREKFREDLYFRMAVVPIDVPPLRDRLGDIPLVAKTLLGRIADLSGSDALSLSPAAIGALQSHTWPGNVRELRNVLERAVFVAEADGHKVISNVFVGEGQSSAPIAATSLEFVPNQSYRDTKAAWEAKFEKRFVEWLLSQHKGNISAAARSADMDRKHLHKLAKRHGVHPKSKKS